MRRYSQGLTSALFRHIERLYKQVESNVRQLGAYTKLGVWFAFVFCVYGFACVALIAPFHTAFLDICDAVHESPNNPHGWTVACFTMASTLSAAKWLRWSPLYIAAYGSLVAQWLLWYWILVSPYSSC